ncbi:uncharacterized protein LOC123881841 [Trifolium pratense]|uniref:uncharacterized protein LOC123881841 n=1 Tax=Trifolium pratense TaxID=57577 RepID=UPI001E690282|nr:uncharacterized protein LOC123881841 [Trifolium pratense]
MKLLTSSPSSSSSTFSFDPTFCSFKTAITTIFHRIICSGSLQTHPSEQIRELHSNFIASEKVQNLNTSSTIVSSSPVVARLMGLDSMVGSSVSHNRSLNSVNSVSQGFHLLENENFLVFSFESGGENSKFKSKGRRKEKGCVELKKKKRENVNVGNGNGEKVKKRKKGKICCVEKKVENECCSDDSSPVSVFDFECDVSGTEEDLCDDVDMSWRRKLSPVLENDQLFTLHSDSNLKNEEKNKDNEIENNMHEGSKRQNNECVDIWSKICKLVEDEFVGNQLKEVKCKKSDFESISADFESEILDELLDEIIDQLVTCCW